MIQDKLYPYFVSQDESAGTDVPGEGLEKESPEGESEKTDEEEAPEETSGMPDESATPEKESTEI